MQDYEKLGAFYLGREQAAAAGSDGGNLLLYDAKDLTTHAMLVGMTGSGKTGLATALIEEAAIDGLPAILIDPKGDLVNLMLQFPDLLPDDFRPWVDEAEALRKGLSPDALAAQTAETWHKGLAQWGQDGERIRRLQAAAEVAVYTPGNTAGRPLQVLRSFAAPPRQLAEDATALRERILSAVSGLLGLMGLNADPIQSRDHILLSTILGNAWREGRSLDLPAIIHEVQKPAFDKVGVFDLESFYPARERFALAMSLNNVIASPGFAAWMTGEPIDVQRLLYTAAGKPRVSILYLAHLSDAERMFFVTILLNEVLAWMRMQSGTGSLRAILYMDEIFGYFPPTANPPSKQPMLTLLKQARAFGLGVVLSTQNPVDLDYKGLANCGTWFIGRLQTERDKLRVIEGLEGAAASTGTGFDRAATEQLLAGLGNRMFLMRNVHDDEPVLFQTRWAMSYLRGPLTLPQLARLNPSKEAPAAPPAAATVASSATVAPAAAAAVPAAIDPTAASKVRPVLPADVPTLFQRPGNPTGAIRYRPRVVGAGKLHFVDARSKLDIWTTRVLLAPFADDGREALWDEALTLETGLDELDREPLAAATYEALPAGATSAKNFAAWGRSLKTALYQSITLDLMTYAALKLVSRPGEPEGDFRARVVQALREQRDLEVAKLKTRYGAKLQTLGDQLRRAQERVDREKTQAGQQKVNTVLSFGATLLGAFLGRGLARVGTVGRATTAMKNASKIGKERADVARAAESVEVLQERLNDMQQQFDAEVAALQEVAAPGTLDIETRTVRPRKSDITVGTVGLCWTPWRVAADGTAEPA
ncbi:MAG: ATP-binding protein [Lentisphaerae bacterium]|nr:ATP-binding protein [Lentisphaerota bacterium]